MPKKMERIWEVISIDIGMLGCKDENGEFCQIRMPFQKRVDMRIRVGDLILVEEFWKSAGLLRKVVDRA